VLKSFCKSKNVLGIQKFFNLLAPLEKIAHTTLPPPTFPRECVKIINDFGTLRSRVTMARWHCRVSKSAKKINKSAQLLKTNRCLGSCDTHTQIRTHTEANYFRQGNI